MRQNVNIQETDNGSFVINQDDQLFAFDTWEKVEDHLVSVFAPHVQGVAANSGTVTSPWIGVAFPSSTAPTILPSPTNYSHPFGTATGPNSPVSVPTGNGTWTFPQTNPTTQPADPWSTNNQVPVKW